jgi:hypothetical protein
MLHNVCLGILVADSLLHNEQNPQAKSERTKAEKVTIKQR